MAAIEVNFQTLLNLKNGIGSYCSYQDEQMSQADFEVKSMLSSDWLGSDAQEFGQKWAGICDNDSQTAKFKNSLIEFGELLDFCANEYRAAQTNAANEAIKLLFSY